MKKMETKDKNIAEVIPAVKLPRALTQSFSYQVPEEMKETLAIGGAVMIPFGRREILGIVKNFSAAAPADFQMKEIKSLVPELNLTAKQLALAEYVSGYYAANLSLTIRLMLPEVTKRESRRGIELAAPDALPEIEPLLCEKVRSGLRERKRLLLLHSLHQERHALYREIAAEQDPAGQTLLLLPEYFDIYESAQYYIDAFGREKVAILCSDITKNQYFAEWKKAKSGQARIVISTRQGVFAPLRNLRLIIVDEEHNSSYKQWDQNPRYHAATAAVELARIHEAAIILASPAPTLESFCRTEEDFTLLDVSRLPANSPRILDFGAERKSGNYSFLFEELRTALLQKIYEKKQALIFIPRLGEKTLHQCRDCGFIAECATCRNPLIGYKNKLYCPRCKELHEPLTACPQCQGQNLGAFGGGSQRIFQELEALFADKNIRIVELDSSTSADGGKNRKIYADFLHGRIDILVGTQMVWKNWHLPNLALVAVIFPEIIFNSPGFRSRERARQFLARLYAFAAEKTVILETHKPDHRYFTEIRTLPAAAFLREELANRQPSLPGIPYPPFGKMVKLVWKDSDPRACEKEAKWQYELFKKEIWEGKLGNSFEIMPPFPAQSYREHGKYRWHLILKCRQDAPREIRDQLLASAKENWILDVDPDEIL